MLYLPKLNIIVERLGPKGTDWRKVSLLRNSCSPMPLMKMENILG
jgi:hypothetical protein